MNWGKDSNCVHWLCSSRVGTSISIDSSIVFTRNLQVAERGGLIVPIHGRAKREE